MRLLSYSNDGRFSLTQFFDHIPPYAILSHTWGPDIEEVSFRDVTDSTGGNKRGYEKIKFCGEQARRDGLQYFWVDTCCINKSDSVELQRSINSMFRWYRDSAKCYVFLADVPTAKLDSTDHGPLPWESAFRRSRWFTRGWTLQELIAPKSVEFFSKDKELLGDKKSLERYISEITRIPSKAFQGSPLATFGAAERMSWIETRKTKYEEDMIYSLLGIFDIFLPLIYGEGRDNARGRLQEAFDKKQKGIKHEDFSIPFSLSTTLDIEQFVAREAELTGIDKALSSDGSRRTVVLHGLGGIGKTQLAIAYAKRHKNDYSAIFWLNIKDEDSLKQGFAKVATQILRKYPSASLLSNIDMKNLDNVIDSVNAWLSQSYNTRWLIIYDNYDNPKLASNKDPTAVDITKYLPEAYQGCVLITTRSSQVEIGYPIHVTKLEDKCDGLQILSNTSRRGGIMDDPDAIKLAKRLDGLPLALATAGAYLKQTAVSFSSYLRLYETLWAKLQKTSPELRSYEDRTLYSTWQISFDHVEQRNILSAQILRLWAYFDNQDLWFELLRHCDSDSPDWAQELIKDELNFHGAMRVLSDHGIVEVDQPSLELVESRGYSIHGCVHSWTVHVLNQEWNNDLARTAIKCVALHVPREEDIRPWATQRRLLQHTARCSYLIQNDLVLDDNIDWAYYNLGLLYADQGKLDLAEEMYERALRGKEKAWGPEHTSTLDTVNNLGLLYADQGKLDLAEEMYERALRGKEKAWGPEHTSTLGTVNNLGNLYKNQGKLDLAEEMYERALEGYKKALRPELTLSYLPVLHTMFAFGDLFSQTDRKDMAKAMYHRALSGYIAVQGPSSKWCRELENRLQELQVESQEGQNEFTEPGAAQSSSLKSKFRKLGRRLNIR